jgi:hypothetical protein
LVFLAFLNMAVGDLQALQAALLLPLSTTALFAAMISHTLILALLVGPSIKSRTAPTPA